MSNQFKLGSCIADSDDDDETMSCTSSSVSEKSRKSSRSSTVETSDKGRRYRAWVFTINNWTQEDLERCRLLKDTCRYTIFGREVAPTTGTRHIQGYAYFTNALTMSALSKKLPRARLEQAKGNPGENREYCSKEGDFEEYGDIPEQGKRTDILEVKTVLDTTGSMLAAYESHFNATARMHSGFEKYLKLKGMSNGSAKMNKVEIRTISLEDFETVVHGRFYAWKDKN